jgi:hypothetical protein
VHVVALFAVAVLAFAGTAVFGPPSDVTSFVDGAPGYQGVTFSAGLEVVFRNQRLTFAKTFVP